MIILNKEDMNTGPIKKKGDVFFEQNLFVSLFAVISYQ